MHTTELPSGNRAHHNGDYSGDVLVQIPRDAVLLTPDVTVYEVKIPMGDLIQIVSDYIRDEMVHAAETADNEAILALYGVLLRKKTPVKRSGVKKSK